MSIAQDWAQKCQTRANRTNSLPFVRPMRDRSTSGMGKMHPHKRDIEDADRPMDPFTHDFLEAQELL